MAPPRAPEGSDGGDVPERTVRRRREHDRARGQQQQVDEVGGRQRGLGPEHPGQEQAERGEGERAGHQGEERAHPTDDTVGRVPPEQQPDHGDDGDLEDLDDHQRADLPGQQPGPGERGGRRDA